MQVGMGYSSEKDAVGAGTAAARQAVETCNSPVLTMLFTTDCYDQQAVVDAVRAVVGDSRLLGFCCGGVVTPEGVLTEGVGVCALGGDELRVVTALESGLSKDPKGVGHRAAEKLLASGIDSGAVFVLPDGFGADISETIRALYERMGPDFTYVGGGSGDNLQFSHTYQFTEEGVQSDALAVGLLSGAKARTAIGHGWQPTGDPLVIGDTKGKKLIEMDGKCAFDAFRDHVGNIAPEEFPDYGMKHPLGFPDIRGNYLIRDPLCLNEDNSIDFVTEIPRNAVCYLMEGKTDELIRSAGHVAEMACQGLEEVKFAVCFDCISRFLLMGDRFVDELQVIREAMGGEVPLLGALTFGEIGSYVGLPLFHNKTLTMVVGGTEQA